LMRVGFNAFFLEQESTGSGQYTRQLLDALAKLDGCNEYLLYAPEQLGSSKKPHCWDSLSLLGTPFTGRSENLSKLWFEQITFPRVCRRASVDLAHVPYFASPLRPSVPTVVTVHDVIPLLLPAYRGSIWVRLYTRLVAAAAERADAIITDSQHSKQDIVRHLHVAPERVQVIYLAADPTCRPVKDAGVLDGVRRKYGLPEKYILYLGGFDRRKNLSTLLRAYAGARRALGGRAPPLVVAGRLPAVETVLFPDPRRLAEESDIERSVVFTGWISDEDKPALYSGALFFCFLSLYEGFGLMPLEAMSCGTPVLASQDSSLPEVVGSGGLLVDPSALDEVVEAMVALMQDHELWQALKQAASAQASRFRWEWTAEQTLRVYDRVLSWCSAEPASGPGMGQHFT
jgi:glycosyltransferase involved in cell wall biosynthesis